jgi:hypothetical protein
MPIAVKVDAEEMEDWKPYITKRAGVSFISAIEIYQGSGSRVYVNGLGGKAQVLRGGFVIAPSTMDALAAKWCQARGIIPGLTEDQVRHAQALEAKMMKIRSQDAPSPDEWEEVGEIEEELAEMFSNILPPKEEACST